MHAFLSEIQSDVVNSKVSDAEMPQKVGLIYDTRL